MEVQQQKTKRKKEDKYFYKDTYQQEIKRQNPNYSNLLNRELGQRSSKITQKSIKVEKTPNLDRFKIL